MAKPKAEHMFDEQLTVLANNLRKSATMGERKMWAEFQKLRLSHGIRFRRQQPIGSFIADFYCAKYKCVVEIDGASHENKTLQDLNRDSYFERLGIRTLRFTESETRNNAVAVIETIVTFLNVPTPPLTPPSRGGELDRAIYKVSAIPAKDDCR